MTELFKTTIALATAAMLISIFSFATAIGLTKEINDTAQKTWGMTGGALNDIILKSSNDAKFYVIGESFVGTYLFALHRVFPPKK